MAAIWRLPFAALIPDPPDRHSLAPDEWITELADWMETYSVVLGSEVHRLQEDSTRAMTLQLERDVVRNFFGLTKEESPVD